MTWCVNPECKNPHNSDGAEVCLSCNRKILLRERYRPIKLIGKGGFGRTFLAIDEDKPCKPHCVVKQLNFLGQNTEALNKAIELFQQEAVLLEKLGKHHSQIPELFAYFKQDERLYIVQEFIEGVNLEDSLFKEGIFSEAKIIQLLREVLPVLEFVHKQKVYHRDIKPPNIIIRTSDNKPVLIDFGVAKVINNDDTFLEKATRIGTVYYAAPEQLLGTVDASSDLYSLGVTCLELMTGIRPISKMYDARNLCWLWQNFLPPKTIISDAFSQILDKLVHHKSKERYQSAEEVFQALPRLDIPPDSLAIFYYTKLELLLESQKWKEADLTTWKLLCTLLGKPAETLIESTDINFINCEYLGKIDHLWKTASSGKFGFTVQCQIFESVARDYSTFCKRVEWPSYDSISYHQNLKFSDKAPVGHLPSRIWGGGDKFWRHLSAMTSKFSQCGITTN
jgi:serine/threonine protein kinase